MIAQTTLPLLPSLFLFSMAVVAGMLNGIAGGGGLIGFPSLLLTGVPPLAANATNTAALWFGTAASSFAYRQELSTQRRELLLLTGTSVLGGALGSYLLLHTSPVDFEQLVPYLLLIATLLFAVNEPIKKRFKGSNKPSSPMPITVILPLQLAIAIYGGFFGGGGGILILAVLDMMGMKNVHAMNAFKSWLATCLNAVALIHFMGANVIVWFPAILMAIGASLGGYASAHFARRLSQSWVRGFITCVGFAMTAYFFVKNLT
ncbi:sulfite exporter TauE/SafE family protein [Scytonema sp. NUACC21]